MTFTDEDLKRLKDHANEKYWRFYCDSKVVNPLLARLEAAEEYIDHLQQCDGCNDEIAYKIWRKACGK